MNTGMKIEKSVLQFRHPLPGIIAGLTSSGKTYLVRKILRNHQETIQRDVNENTIKVL